jgi:UDP-N-acetylglucosamine--N-acetylmuramyl-(pentapeptide) pyrophosphoryl-undecaprenol N-acetylglucosamine transferase
MSALPTHPGHLVVMAAGTGGHVMPGLAVAQEMRQRGWSVSWLGTQHGMENRLVPPTGIPLDTVDFSGMRGKGVMHAVRGARRGLRAMLHARRILRQRHATVVLGMGGYVCMPGGLAARWLRMPLMLVNADAGLLLSNKSLAPLAQRVAFGFEGAAAASTPRSVITGNPVRAEIEALPSPALRFAGREGRLRLLVVGGSLGAQVINQVVPKALALIPEHERPLVIHQTGADHVQSVRDAYRAAGLNPNPKENGTTLDVVPFIEDMAAHLGGCDLMIGRAGAITVSELCAAGVASVLVPLIVSTTAHQRDNAVLMEQHEAAVHLPQTKLSPQTLVQLLQAVDRSKLLAMAQRARALSKPRAAARVADEIQQLQQPLSFLGARA